MKIIHLVAQTDQLGRDNARLAESDAFDAISRSLNATAVSRLAGNAMATLTPRSLRHQSPRPLPNRHKFLQRHRRFGPGS